jgi:hypothetical protein
MAKRVIMRDGEQVLWQQTYTVANVQKWKTGTSVVRAYAVQMAFVQPKGSLNSLIQLVKGTDVTALSMRGLMAGGIPFVPSLTDRVIRGGKVLDIASIQEVKPADTVILYRVDFKA